MIPVRLHRRLPLALSSRSTRVLATALVVACTVAAPARAARLELPLSGSPPAPMTGGQRVGGRMVLRLRSDVSAAARLDYGNERDERKLALARSPALAGLAARLRGAWFEPEFPGEKPGKGDAELATFWIAHLTGGLPLGDALDAARATSEVLEASPITLEPLDPVVETAAPAAAVFPPGGRLTQAAPNDSMFGLCYWQYQPSRKDIHLLEAWDVTQGDSSTIVAIIDSGVLRDHPDLGGTDGGWGNLWVNQAELHGLPGVDDDGNGFVDDVWGWDFVNADSTDPAARPGEDWQDADADPNDFAVHGTACAGIVAAIANNGSGVAGVAPRARVMALRAGYSATINPAGIIDLSWASQAIVYAVRNGATVINCSFASDQQPDLVAAVNFATAAGVVVVAAAGNNGTHNYLGSRDDVICVGATDQDDKVTLFSNRLPFVDLCAPGQSIATLSIHATGTDSVGVRQATYSPAEAGTSFSSPMVAAAAALLQASRRAHGLRPLAPYLAQLRITETTDNINGLNPGTGFGSGRLNIARMFNDPPTSSASPAGAATIGPAVILPTQSGTAWIAYATADSGLLIVHAVSGDTVAREALPARPTGGIAAADLGGGLGTGLFVALENGEIAGFRSAGGPLAGWPVDATTSRGEFETMPTLGDLDGDGRPEIVWGGDDGNVWAWHADGTRVAGFPRRAGTAGRNLRVALGNLDGHPGLDIVVSSNNYAVYAFSGAGAPLPNWPVIIGDDPTAPVLMRLGTNPMPMVVVAGDTTIRAYRPDGTLKWRRGLPFPIAQDLAAGDVTGDGRDDIVALMSRSDDIAVLDSNGTATTTRFLTVHSSGPPLIGSLSTGPGGNVLFPSPDNQGHTRYYALTSALNDLPGWPKPGHPSTEPSMADVDGDGATELAAGSGSDGLIYLYDAGPGSFRPAFMGWPTPRGNFARTGSRLTASALLAGDDVPPTAIADLHGTAPTTHTVVLRWSAPRDPGAGAVQRYEVRVANAPIGGPVVGTVVAQSIVPAAPDAPESLFVAGLGESAHWWFVVRGRDATGNWAPWSNPFEFDAPTLAPAAVADLRVAAGTDSSLTLAWSATGDDGEIGRPARYLVRLANAPMDSAAFAHATLGADVSATQDAGHTESVTLRGFTSGERFWIGIRAVDAAGNASAISNQIAPTVGRLARIGGVALLPTRSPARVPVEIEWQGDPAAAAERQAIELFDVGGRFVAGFDLPHQSSGVLRWDGRSDRGTLAGAGVYFARLRSGRRTASTRIVFLR